MQLSQEALEARRKYFREYNRKNKEKRQQREKQYWENKALKESLVAGSEKGVGKHE